MIENYRTGLLWNPVASAPEVKNRVETWFFGILEANLLDNILIIKQMW